MNADNFSRFCKEADDARSLAYELKRVQDALSHYYEGKDLEGFSCCFYDGHEFQLDPANLKHEVDNFPRLHWSRLVEILVDYRDDLVRALDTKLLAARNVSGLAKMLERAKNRSLAPVSGDPIVRESAEAEEGGDDE